MGLRTWWQHRQLTRAKRYLAAQPDLALRALRQSPELGLAAVTAYWDRHVSLQAGTPPDRKTAPWPILTQLGHGARHALTQTLPKVSPYNLRKFCFDSETEVLTRRGWIAWPHVTASDVFATFNIATGCAEWQKAERLYRYRVDGPMLRFLSRDVDALVTPEHKMLGRFRKGRDIWNGHCRCSVCGKPFRNPSGLGAHRRFIHGIRGTWQEPAPSYRYSACQLVEAQEVQWWTTRYAGPVAAFEIPFSARWTGTFPQGYDPETATVPVACYPPSFTGGPTRSHTIRLSLADLVAFLGIYIAEGSSEGSYMGMDLSATSALPHYQQALAALMALSPYRPRSYRVRVAQTQYGKRAEVEALLARLPWRFQPDKDEKGFAAYNRYLWEMVHPLGNTYTKFVPQWIKDLPPEYVRIFLDWAMKGDGCITEDGCHIYFTASKQLADDMQELFQRSGTSARVTKKASRGSAPWGVSAARSAPLYMVHEKKRAFYGVRARHITQEEYHGDVYCVDVPNKTVYVRRNGKAFWCGRSEYPPARRAINAITNPLVELAWQVRKIPDPDDPKAAPSLAERVQMALATRVLTTPNDDDSWRTCMEAVLEDIVVGGYGALEVGVADDPTRPVYLWPVDGQSIRINANWDPAFPDEPRYSQALAYVGMSVGTHDRVELRDDELIYVKLNPRTHTPFGLGYLEVAFSTINAWLGAMEHSERMASNAIPNVAIFLGEHVDLTTARQWRAYWQEQIEGYGQVPILGGGPKPEVMDLRGTGTDQLYIAWQEMLLRVIAMAFGLSPLTLALQRDVNRSTASQEDVQDWDSIKPVAGTVKDYLDRRLLWKTLGYTTLEFEWRMKDTDEARQAQILGAQWEMDAITVDELRAVYAREPLPNGLGQLTKTPSGC